MEEEEKEAAAIATAIAEGKAEGSLKKPKPGLKAIKYRIFLLIGIVAAFIVILLLMDMLAGGGNSGRSAGHMLAFETINIYKSLDYSDALNIINKA